MPPPVTLKDIARELGLSVPAVSLGLRHSGNISKETCRRIEETAKRMGYRPNPHAAALSSRVHSEATHGVPLAVFRMPLRKNSNNMYPVSNIVEGIIQRAKELGYNPQIITVGDTATLSRQLRVLYNQGVQGIFLPPIGSKSVEGDIDWSPFSVVACGRYDVASPFHSVRQEIFESTRFLIKETIRRGYKRISLALLRHDTEILDDFARLGAASICHPGGDGTVKVHFLPKEDPSSFINSLKKEKPDAVIGFTIRYYYEMVKAGFKIPEKIAFAALHGATDQWGDKITALIMPNEHAGFVAANRMDAMIRHHERGIPSIPEQISIASTWHEGTTLPFRNR